MYIVFFILIIFLSSCFPFPDKNRNTYGDISAPIFLGLNTDDSTSVRFFFDEKIYIKDKMHLRIDKNNEISEYFIDEETLLLRLSNKMRAGEKYIAELQVSDKKGNTTLLATSFFGYNDNLPELVINEFRVTNSSSRPEAVELYCTKAGNLAGVTIYRGSSEFYETKLIFPNLTLVAGDYIVVHFRPENIPEEIDETEGKDLSGGKESGPDHYDFWVREGGGISGTNGAISLYTNPRGKIIDAVCYTNRTYIEGERYGSFGTSTAYNSINSIFEQGGWTTANAELITPNDCISVVGATATRTICREITLPNTKSKDNWYIVPTSSSTMGSTNCTERYDP
ncbi:MAG: hypothetical protein JXR63_07350 [Spirochaetales bacterium]|nr:hypothetical protein [Spirochaetales bacterium]